MDICPICKGRTIRKKVNYNILGEAIGVFLAEVCQKCGEQFFNKEVSITIERIAKEKGIWSLTDKTRVSKVGNALAVRINKKISEYLELKKGEEIFIQPEGKGKIVMTRV